MADILVVDDDASVAGALRRFLNNEGHASRVVNGVAEGMQAIAERRPDLVMMDIRMPGLDGLTGLTRMQAGYPGLCVVMMTGYGTSQTSIDAMRAGAFDYLTKPPDLDALRRVIARALASGTPVASADDAAAPSKPSLVGETPAMVELYKMIGRLSKNDVPALFVGEQGTGKGLAIAMLHDSSARSGQPLVRIDCMLPAVVLEDAIFGDAMGTLHLSNIEALPPAIQTRLVRALSDADRVQSTERIRARVLASTTADLVAAVNAGAFRRELYDVVSLITIRLPPLRERRDDLPLLIRHFIRTINIKLNRAIRAVDDQAAKRLQEHGWPGNIGELERVLTRAAILAGGDTITSNDIAFLTDAVYRAGTEGLSSLEQSVRSALQERLVDAPKDASVFHHIVDAVEAALVKEALSITNGNQVKASELLGLNRATLRKKAPSE
ncbi:MAG TPA: sigma-54 dependent transcriptional regulator [Vicinamibacterales bacterium]|nr:sigma-54 dependent transcriptional regulator [Vicinamibacterales bacterium]